MYSYRSENAASENAAPSLSFPVDVHAPIGTERVQKIEHRDEVRVKPHDLLDTFKQDYLADTVFLASEGVDQRNIHSIEFDALDTSRYIRLPAILKIVCGLLQELSSDRCPAWQ